VKRIGNRVLGVVALVLGGILATHSSALARVPTPQADYRFNLNLKSSVNKDDAPAMREVGGGFSYYFASIGGQRDNYLNWVSGSGLKLPNAQKVIGTPGDYTIAMLINLDDVDDLPDDYCKLVDFDDLQSSGSGGDGWFVHEGFLNPYSVEDVPETGTAPITEEAWHLIVMTRAGGNVKGYVDNERYFTLPDPTGEEVLGIEKVLHFLMDDGTGSEETGGKIARLRIWKNPLTNKQAKSLKPQFN
jgi:Concanavalin A-like lectin/glucanases superfamily